MGYYPPNSGKEATMQSGGTVQEAHNSAHYAVRQEMERLGWTYADLAYVTKLSGPYLCRVVNGTRKPSPAALIAIAKGLHIPPAALASMLEGEATP
jgi:transcriptional regulator with XRE-family HTH domain